MTSAAPDAGNSGFEVADERSVVVLRGTRPQARLFGSVLGPTALLPGDPGEGWQVLAVLPGGPPGGAIVKSLLYAPVPDWFRSDDVAAVALGRTGPRWRILVPVSETVSLVRTWYPPAQSHTPPDDDGIERLTSHLLTLAPGSSEDDVRAALLDERGEGQPLRDLLAALELPGAALEVLVLDDSILDQAGEVLLRADKKRHTRAALATARAGGQDPAEAGRESGVGLPTPVHWANRFFGVVYPVLGVIACLLGAIHLLTGRETTGTLLGMGHPAAWVALGAVLIWWGWRSWNKGQRQPTAGPQ